MPTRPMKSRRKKGAIKDQSSLEAFSANKDGMHKKNTANATTTDGPEPKKHKLDGEEELFRMLLQTTHETENLQRHELFPAFNMNRWPPQSCNELRNYPSCSLSTVEPLHVASSHVQCVDICHRRTMARECYKKRLLTARTRFQTTRQGNRKLRKMEKKNFYHMSLFDLAERLKRNPDEYFHGSYDYYYTGGNLCTVPKKGTHVLHVDGDNLQHLNLAELTLDDDSLCWQPLRARCLDGTNEIFEIRALSSPHKNRSNLIGVRQRNCITLHTLRPHLEHPTKPLIQFKSSNTPFISFAQSPNELNVLLVSSMKQHVRWYDLNAPTPNLQKLYNLNSNEKNDVISWNTVKPWRDRMFIYASERKLCCMDMRTTPKEWLKSSCGFSDGDFGCEQISALKSSEFCNLLYVGTSHKLHCLDMRYMRPHFADAEGAVCCWTHQLEYAPAFMDIYQQDDVEFIALASALAGDLRICELTKQHDVEPRKPSGAVRIPKPLYKSYCLPYQPVTLHEAYESARLAGKCLQPEADLAQRIRSCTTGLAICGPFASPAADGTHAVLLTSNSNGDVFAQCINKRATQTDEPRNNALSNEIMSTYSAKIRQLTQPDLYYTDVVDISVMKKVFRCSVLNMPEKVEVEEVALPKQRAMMGRWQKSMSALYAYKDALAPAMLTIWDIDYEEEKYIKLRQLNESQRIKPDPDAIVSSWLNATMAKAPMTAIPVQNLSSNVFGTQGSAADLSTIFTPNERLDMEWNALPQSTQIMDETIGHTETSQLEMQQTLNNTTMFFAQKKTKTVKKSKYIKGF